MTRKMPIINTLCYKQHKPTIYNKGTQWEKQCDTFLWCELLGYSDEQANELANRLNNEKPTEYNGRKIDWNEIKEFYINKQEKIDTYGD